MTGDIARGAHDRAKGCDSHFPGESECANFFVAVLSSPAGLIIVKADGLWNSTPYSVWYRRIVPYRVHTDCTDCVLRCTVQSSIDLVCEV